MKSTFFLAFALAFGNLFALDMDLTGKAYLPKNPAFAPIRAGMAVQAKSDTAKPSGVTVLRKQLPQGQVAFFEGRLQKSARDSMSFFQPLALDAWDLILHARFFTATPGPNTKELQEIYWDGSILIVPSEVDSLFAQTDKGTSVFLSISGQPVTVRLETNPRGAVVRVKDNILGTTPTEFQWLNGRWVWIRLEKLGYFSWEDIIEADPDKATEISIKLVERPTFQDGTMADSNGIIAHGSKDFGAIESMLSRITSTRLSREAQDAAQWLNLYLDTLRNRQYVEYIPPQYLSVEAWDAQKGGMPVRLWYGSNDFDFGFTGLIPCNQDEAYALAELLKAKQRSATLKGSTRARRASWPSAHATAQLDGFVRLTYRNWLADTRSQSRNVKRYFALDGLELVLPEQTITLPGTFVPAAYITQSPEWKAFIDFTREQELAEQAAEVDDATPVEAPAPAQVAPAETPIQVAPIEQPAPAVAPAPEVQPAPATP